MSCKELNAKDLSVLLEALRGFCSRNPYDPTLVMTLLDRAIHLLQEEEKVDPKIVLSLARAAYACRVDSDEVFNALTQMMLDYLQPDAVRSDPAFCSNALYDLARCHQNANFDLILNRVISVGGFETCDGPQSVVQVVSSLVLLEYYDSPLLLSLLDKLCEMDE